MTKKVKLPPHLAKLFDKDGNPKRKDLKNIKFKLSHTIKDVTPKGYGPNDEEEIKEAITRKTKDPEFDVDNDGDLDKVPAGGQKSGIVTKMYGRRGIKEDAPTVNAGSGNIAGIGVGPKGEPGVSPSVQRKHAKNVLRRAPPQALPMGTFWGQKTFIVPDRMVNEVRMQKRKGKWWTNYLGENDEISNAIREYANANPCEPIILEGENYGHIVFARYGK